MGIAVAALVVTLALATGWELYWRTQWHFAGDYKNNSGLWAEQRRHATGDATVIIGSSRALFGFDLGVWEETGRGRPVQLALEGTSPRAFLTDFANDPKFHGLLIVDVFAPQFFTTRGGRRLEVLRYTQKETPSEWADHQLSLILERNFAFTDEQIRPKRMLFLAELPLRPGMEQRWDPPKLPSMDADRNAQLWKRVLEDKPYRDYARAVWPHLPRGAPPSPEGVAAIVAELNADIAKIRARGGEVVFNRMPHPPVEDGPFPREKYWDRIVAETNSVGLYFKDDPALQGYPLPDNSHIAPQDRARYTRALTRDLYAQLDARKAVKQP